MARQRQATGAESSLPFPLSGVDDSAPFCKQPPLTTIRGENVRAVDTIDDRARGGSRPGTTRVRADPPTPAPTSPPACAPGGGTDFSDATNAGPADYHLAPRDHWFVKTTTGSPGSAAAFTARSDGLPFLEQNPAATWAVWTGNGTDPPADVTGQFGAITVDTYTYFQTGEPVSTFGGKLYLVLGVPPGCVPAEIDYFEYSPS